MKRKVYEQLLKWKETSHGRTALLIDFFIRKYNEQLDVPVILHTADLSEREGILFLPVYMTCLL